MQSLQKPTLKGLILCLLLDLLILRTYVCVIVSSKFNLMKSLELLIQSFEVEQTIEKLNSILLCVELKRMECNKWVNDIKDISLPVRFVRLYSKVGHQMVLTGLGIF